jgi:hypothetical protein
LFKRPFASETGTRNLGQAWLSIAIFTLAIVYSILYEGHWPVVRDYVNILDKGNWNLFGIYALIVWTLVLVIMPGTIYLLALISKRLSGYPASAKAIFLASAGSLLPAGLMLWIAFVIPMLFTNVSFILQSLSDPFGWGWDFLGTANTPWHQFLPRFIPMIQTILILLGLYLSLRNLTRNRADLQGTVVQRMALTLPAALFITLISTWMIFFFTN